MCITDRAALLDYICKDAFDKLTIILLFSGTERSILKAEKQAAKMAAQIAVGVGPSSTIGSQGGSSERTSLLQRRMKLPLQARPRFTPYLVLVRVLVQQWAL